MAEKVVKLVKITDYFPVQGVLLAFQTLILGSFRASAGQTFGENRDILTEKCRKLPIFGTFLINAENGSKIDENGVPIQVFPKDGYGMKINTFGIFTFLPSYIFKQNLGTPKPHKNTIKMTKKWSKMWQK